MIFEKIKFTINYEWGVVFEGSYYSTVFYTGCNDLRYYPSLPLYAFSMRKVSLDMGCTD